MATFDQWAMVLHISISARILTTQAAHELQSSPSSPCFMFLDDYNSAKQQRLNRSGVMTHQGDDATRHRLVNTCLVRIGSQTGYII